MVSVQPPSEHGSLGNPVCSEGLGPNDVQVVPFHTPTPNSSDSALYRKFQIAIKCDFSILASKPIATINPAQFPRPLAPGNDSRTLVAVYRIIWKPCSPVQQRSGLAYMQTSKQHFQTGPCVDVLFSHFGQCNYPPKMYFSVP